MKRISVVVLLFSVFVSSCQRNDDEPSLPERPISRLYISTSDYDNDGGSSLQNIYVVDPADTSTFPPVNSIYKFQSGAKGGRFITYSPFNGGLVFQGSQNLVGATDTSIYVMNIGNRGDLRPRNSVTYSRLNQVRGMTYIYRNDEKITADFLLALNGNVVSDSLLIFNNAVNNVRNRTPRYYLPLDYNSWGISAHKNNLVVSSFVSTTTTGTKPKAFNGLVVYNDLLSQLRPGGQDSLLTNVGRYNLIVDGAKTVRGISYSDKLDLLVMVDYERVGESSKGRILLFEKFYERYTAAQTITADRVITSNGKLRQPLDVAVDGREGRNYIYVADSDAKLVYRYSVTDNGDVLPNQELSLEGRTPVSLSLDAR